MTQTDINGNTFVPDIPPCPSCLAHDAEALAIRRLFIEIDCRIEHGANSNGHLEYVRDRLNELMDVSRPASEVKEEK
jgi:hypothetical protein